MLTNNKSAKLSVAELFKMNQLLFFPVSLDRWQSASAVAGQVETPTPGLSKEDEVQKVPMDWGWEVQRPVWAGVDLWCRCHILHGMS